MQRLELMAHGEPAEVVQLSTDKVPALRDGEVLIAMEAAPINPSDFMLIRGTYRVRPSFPFALGSEGVGRIVELGPHVDSSLKGRRALIIPNHEQGTWADHVVVHVNNVVTLRDDADPVQLSMIGINGLTAYLLLSRYVSLMPGDWIGQTAGNSAMGEYIFRLAKVAGVNTLNVVRREEAAEQVRQFGGDHVVVQSDTLHDDIEKILDGRKLSLVLDCIGGSAAGQLARSLGVGGAMACYGVQDGQFPLLSPYEFIFRGLGLHGFSVSNWLINTPRSQIQEIYRKLSDLVAEGSLSVSVDSVLPLRDFKDAFARSAKSARNGKIVLKFGS